MTIDQCVISEPEVVGRLSRHREEVRMYSVAEASWVARSEEEMHGAVPVPEPAERLAGVTAAIGRDGSKQTALDALEADPAARRRSAQQDRVAQLIQKRRDSGRRAIKDLTELQRIQRLLRLSEDNRQPTQQNEAQRPAEQRRRDRRPDREIGR